MSPSVSTQPDNASRQPAQQIADAWIERFNQALSTDSVSLMQSLFLADSHWRNILGIGWEFATVSGAARIATGLLERASATAVRGMRAHPDRVPAAYAERAGQSVIEVAVQFESRMGRGIGLLRLRQDNAERFFAWSLMTAIESVTGTPDRDALHPVPADDRHGSERTDLTARSHPIDDGHLQVLVVGGGHNGICAAVELAQLGLECVVVDANARVGDNWRKRYQSLCLHNKTPSNHLPYLPFPSSFPDYIPKDQIADWLETYVDRMKVNFQTQTEFAGARRNDDDSGWLVRLVHADGSEQMVQCPHIVMATSTSGTPSIPQIAGLEDFAGTVLHSSQYVDGGAWRDQPVTVFGTGTSAHDVCQDLHRHGAQVTMVQRSPTMIVNLEPGAQLYDQIYYDDEGPPLADRDLINSSVPLPIVIQAHQRLTTIVREIDAPLLARLERVGFRLEFGEDGTGWPLKYRRRGGGYYFNVGCSELIADGQIDLIQFHDVAHIDSGGLQMKDGSHRNSRLLVLATGYHGQEHVISQKFGPAVADRVGKIWGFDPHTQEMCNMWTKTNQSGLWFTAGSFSQARIYSKYLAMQIWAEVS